MCTKGTNHFIFMANAERRGRINKSNSFFFLMFMLHELHLLSHQFVSFFFLLLLKLVVILIFSIPFLS